MGSGKPQRKMRNFLLDKRFQLKYTLAVVLVSSAISAGLGYFLYQAHRESSQVASLDDPDLDGALSAELRTEDRKVLFFLFTFLGGLVLALSAVGIVATHKIAGPAYAMRRKLSEIADGKLPIIHELRRGDELKAVAEELRRMAGALREREEHDVRDLSAIASGLEQQGANDQAGELRKIVEQKQQRLGVDA
ncbi:MAG TPA: hypothetical protein VM425_07265 [Myxococcota bacterium]|nr:hypothetical protein [Myxococcota bacterium]